MQLRDAADRALGSPRSFLHAAVEWLQTPFVLIWCAHRFVHIGFGRLQPACWQRQPAAAHTFTSLQAIPVRMCKGHQRRTPARMIRSRCMSLLDDSTLLLDSNEQTCFSADICNCYDIHHLLLILSSPHAEEALCRSPAEIRAANAIIDTSER